MKRIAVLISNIGTGTNLQAIIDATEAKKRNKVFLRISKAFLRINAKIVVVISDTKDAFGIKRAKKHKLAVAICKSKEDLFPLLAKYDPDFIALAGWKQIIPDDVIDSYRDRILNVHPGLIPNTSGGSVKNPDGTVALWNKGKLAAKAIRNFLDQKATYAGSSIHFLTHEFDFGPVLARGFVKIKKGDTVDSLYGRLKKVEHQIYIESLQKLCNPK